MELKYKKLVPNTHIPFQATKGSSKLDLTPISVELTRIKSGSYRLVYGFGLAFEFDEGLDLKLYPRSSQSKFDLTLSNGVGIGDSDYRGEYKAVFNIDFSNLKVDTFTKHTYRTLTVDGQADVPMKARVPCTYFEELSLKVEGDNVYLMGRDVDGVYCDTQLPLTLFPLNERAIIQIGLESTHPIQLVEVNKLTDTLRGDGGFGSTDKKIIPIELSLI